LKKIGGLVQLQGKTSYLMNSLRKDKLEDIEEKGGQGEGVEGFFRKRRLSTWEERLQRGRVQLTKKREKKERKIGQGGPQLSSIKWLRERGCQKVGK